MTDLLFLFKPLFLLMFLYCCGFVTSLEIGPFRRLNQYLPAILYRYNLIVISFHALRYRSNWKPDFLAKPYMENIFYNNGYKLFHVRCLSNIGFLLVFSSLVFYFFDASAYMCFSLYDSVSIFSLCNMWVLPNE